MMGKIKYLLSITFFLTSTLLALYTFITSHQSHSLLDQYDHSKLNLRSLKEHRNSHKERNNHIPLRATIPHTSMQSLNLSSVQLSLKKLQCNQQYRKQYNEYINTLDIIKLVAPELASSSRTGYILSLNYREQQTKASENLLFLQCWAKTFRAYIVEPFVEDSHLIASFDEERAGLLKFRDVFNIARWQQFTTMRGLTPLVGWERFAKEAPRDLIVVQFKYPNYSHIREKKEKKEKLTRLAIGRNYTKGCIVKQELEQKVQLMINKLGFKVVRRACINFEYGDQLSVPQFNAQVYADLQPKQHTVLMEQWRGAGNNENGNRVSVFDACWTHKWVEPYFFTWPTHQLICDADKYLSQYFKSNQYIAVIVRTEKFKRHGTKGLANETRISSCLKKTLDTVNKLKRRTRLKLTYLSMDIGKYGSYSLTGKTYMQEQYQSQVYLYEQFIKDVLGSNSSITTWEHEIESVASRLDSGYIGSLQKTLVAKAKCVVFAGGGSFQRHAKFMYDRIHKNKCVKIVESCSRTSGWD